MVNLRFPHVSRKFSAKLFSYSQNSLLWACLTVLFAINVFARINLTPSYWGKLEATLLQPFSAASHQRLAQEFWMQGLRDAAQKEAVLGASTEKLEELSENLEQKYNYWQSVVLTHPDYRDAYIILASLAYQLGKIEEAKKYLNQAIMLDPNNKALEK